MQRRQFFIVGTVQSFRSRKTDDIGKKRTSGLGIDELPEYWLAIFDYFRGSGFEDKIFQSSRSYKRTGYSFLVFT